MCTVTIKIDEAVLRGLNPEWNSTAAIRKWAQELVDFHIHELAVSDVDTLDIEAARNMVLETVRKEYAKV